MTQASKTAIKRDVSIKVSISTFHIFTVGHQAHFTTFILQIHAQNA